MENTLPDLPFDINLAGTSNPTESEISILAAISNALRSQETETELKSAQSLAKMCPPIPSNHDIEAYLWELWTILIGVARCIPHDAERPGQGTVVGILSRLRECDRGTVQIWGRELKLWQDLPLFSQRMADTWSGLLVDNNTATEESASAWRNQHAFAARCLEAGIAGWDDYATRQLRAALEDRYTADHRAGEFQILAATEWIIHSSGTLFRWSKEDEDGESCDDDVKPGELFDGKPGLSTKRWNFWKSRFKEICQEEALYSKEVQIAAGRAVEEMDKAESPSVPV